MPEQTLADVPTDVLEMRIALAKLAKHDLIAYAQLANPDPHAPFDCTRSTKQWKSFHKRMARELKRVANGELKYLEIETPPRIGKTQMSVREFVPWMLGNHPEKSGLVITHTDTLALEHGRDVKDAMLGIGHTTVFGGRGRGNLRRDSRSSDRIKVVGGATVHFSGRAGLGAGLSADWIIIDDWFKNSEEAQSLTVREEAWRTYNADLKSRMNDERVPVIMIGSRRNADDVQGRIFDPSNLHYDEKEAAKWTRIRFPALAEENDPLGRALDEPLWPEKFGFEHLDAMRTHKSDIIREDFQTQYQCRPFPEEGSYFKKHYLKTYSEEELPKHLRVYGFSDHAYRTKQKNDRSCCIMIGVDPSGDLWVLPDVFWDRCQTDVLVEAMIDLMARHNPSCWWAARDAISGSIGPFLKKRQRERRVLNYVNDEIHEDKDLERRAQSIRNMMAMGSVHFPSFAKWWPDAKMEIVGFPKFTTDDFVATMALAGMAIMSLSKAEGPWVKPKSNWPEPLTLAWVKGKQLESAQEEKARKAMVGW